MVSSTHWLSPLVSVCVPAFCDWPRCPPSPSHPQQLLGCWPGAFVPFHMPAPAGRLGLPHRNLGSKGMRVTCATFYQPCKSPGLAIRGWRKRSCFWMEEDVKNVQWTSNNFKFTTISKDTNMCFSKLPSRVIQHYKVSIWREGNFFFGLNLGSHAY